jgi:Trk-type K+ transport system membrane component
MDLNNYDHNSNYNSNDNDSSSGWNDPQQVYIALVWFLVIIFGGFCFACLFRVIEILDFFR